MARHSPSGVATTTKIIRVISNADSIAVVAWLAELIAPFDCGQISLPRVFNQPQGGGNMGVTEIIILLAVPVLTIVICIVDTQDWVGIVKQSKSKQN